MALVALWISLGAAFGGGSAWAGDEASSAEVVAEAKYYLYWEGWVSTFTYVNWYYYCIEQGGTPYILEQVDQYGNPTVRLFST